MLRQDPDIILVGEMRDLETISVALTAAETGHLVFATLHTQDAAQTIDRIIDVFPPHQQQQVRVQLAGTLQGVVCQTLARTRRRQGRAVATEVLVATPAIRNLIREGKTHQIYSAMQAGAQHGMHTMDQHLADLVKRGRITYETGLEKCHHIEDFNRPHRAEAERQVDHGSHADLPSTRSGTGPARSSRGKIDADSPAAVAHQAQEHGLRAGQHHQASSRRHVDRDLSCPGSARKVKLKDLAIFSRQFATMINSGLSLLRALTILEEQTENKELAKVLTEVRQDVETGQALSRVAGQAPARSSRR